MNEPVGYMPYYNNPKRRNLRESLIGFPSRSYRWGIRVGGETHLIPEVFDFWEDIVADFMRRWNEEKSLVFNGRHVRKMTAERFIVVDANTGEVLNQNQVRRKYRYD